MTNQKIQWNRVHLQEGGIKIFPTNIDDDNKTIGGQQIRELHMHPPRIEAHPNSH